jgi:hypothetical protein
VEEATPSSRNPTEGLALTLAVLISRLRRVGPEIRCRVRDDCGVNIRQQNSVHRQEDKAVIMLASIKITGSWPILITGRRPIPPFEGDCVVDGFY